MPSARRRCGGWSAVTPLARRIPVQDPLIRTCIADGGGHASIEFIETSALVVVLVKLLIRWTSCRFGAWTLRSLYVYRRAILVTSSEMQEKGLACRKHRWGGPSRTVTTCTVHRRLSLEAFSEGVRVCARGIVNAYSLWTPCRGFASPICSTNAEPSSPWRLHLRGGCISVAACSSRVHFGPVHVLVLPFRWSST
ncbi:hypothetical protein PPTG_21455 [Phytophthora nicotianae INRA-310]|uniref:Uncharacterized protein n=1 Tax=Phytophthora nicotianae (strain INRA-310) TaxID=761204 RepID=W2R410_PHYN3|nr:hypothetical protein PPTG_21455 [Phytophthora nicotianae INRA-310]ETN19429.1 hypothetical protein PPTG_21455 [Phytophthora nicotianae INRA-310]